MPVVRAGMLRTPLVLEKRTPTPDGDGGETSEWNQVAIVRGRVRALKAEERQKAMQTESPITHEIEIRFREDLNSSKTEDWRFRKGARVFNIDSVLDLEERRWKMKIGCVEGVVT